MPLDVYAFQVCAFLALAAVAATAVAMLRHATRDSDTRIRKPESKNLPLKDILS